MATVLDFSILGSLSVVFVFLAVFIGAWGLLSTTDMLGLKDKKSVYAVLALAIAFLVVLSQNVLNLVAFTMPWFAVLTFVGFFMLFFAKMFNPNLNGAELIRKSEVHGFLIFFTAIIVIFGLANSFGQQLLEKQPGVTTADQISGNTMPTNTFVPVNQSSATNASNTASTTAPSTGNIGSNIVLTIFNPKILGMLFMMLLGTVTILLIARNN